MLKLAAFIVICVSFAAGQAQSSRKPPEVSPQGQIATANSQTGTITLRGCVQAGKERSTFVQESTGTEFLIAGSADDPAKYQGKLVRITATESAPASTTPNAKAVPADAPQLQISKIEVVANVCPLDQPSAGRPTTTDPTVGNQPVKSQRPSPDGTEPVNINGATGAPSPGTNDPRNTQQGNTQQPPPDQDRPR